MDNKEVSPKFTKVELSFGCCVGYSVNALEEKKKEVAERVVALLKSKGWSQAELGRQSGLPRSFITKILQADANLTLSSIVALETAFEASILKVSKR